MRQTNKHPLRIAPLALCAALVAASASAALPSDGNDFWDILMMQ